MSMLSCAAAEPPTPSRSAAGKGRPGAARNAAQASAARIDLSQCLMCIVPLQIRGPAPRTRQSFCLTRGPMIRLRPKTGGATFLSIDRNLPGEMYGSLILELASKGRLALVSGAGLPIFAGGLDKASEGKALP